ncbi:MAG: hypothetical protein V5A38_02925 [Halolamina sp.]|uniref:hypothetical protein n=1 Tax=Halolamina sp. TaxID=1940283 RepID=UPI002FC3B78A
MPSRRRYLTAVSAVLIGLAGCTSGPGGTVTTTETEPTDTEPKKSPSGTPTEPPEAAKRSVGGDTVAVTDIVVKKAVTYQSTMGSGGVVAVEGKQFVVASVQSDAELSMDAFSLRAAGDEWVAGTLEDTGATNYAVEGHEGGPLGKPIGGDGPNYVVFEIPSPLDVAESVIHLDHNGESAEWALGDDAVTTLAAPEPSFELDSLSAPDSVRQGDQMDVSLTVSNSSDTDGRFLAAVYWPTELIADDDESHIVETAIDTGATTTQSLSIDTEYTTNEDGPITLRVGGHVSAETEVVVEDASTPD